MAVEEQNTISDSFFQGKKIWALVDDRAGNANQAIGVAERLGGNFIKKNIAYNAFAALPNILRGNTLLGVDADKSDVLEAPYPDIIISAGRRCAPVARHIQMMNAGESFVVQMMWPDCAPSDFDLIVMPQHDRPRKGDNILRVPGAPHRVTQAILDEAKARWEPEFSEQYEPPFTALLMGGGTKKGNLSEAYLRSLANTLSKRMEETGGTLLVTASRRTPLIAKRIFAEVLKCSYYYYDPKNKDENPYFGLLSIAETIVVSGDSMSMCSESCATGVPVYITLPDEVLLSKHKRFHQHLFDAGYARPLGDESFESWEAEQLDVSTQIKEAIIQRMQHVG